MKKNNQRKLVRKSCFIVGLLTVCGVILFNEAKSQKHFSPEKFAFSNKAATSSIIGVKELAEKNNISNDNSLKTVYLDYKADYPGEKVF